CLDGAPARPQLVDDAAGDKGLADIGAGGGDEDGSHAALATRVRTRSASRAMSPSSWRAVKAKRSRAVPSGTVGGRIGTTRKPSASRRRAAASAASGPPTISGTIWLFAGGSPARAVKARALASGAAGSAGFAAMRTSAGTAGATDPGGRAVGEKKRRGRA